MSSERLPPRPSLRALTAIGLLAAGLGFVGASADPGPGPITVHGSLTVGNFYLPPLLTGLTALAIAALISTTHSRLTPAIGSLLAIILLIGSVTAGADAVSYRLTHPEHPLGFTEDWLQIIGETLAAVAGGLTAIRRQRHRRAHHQPYPTRRPPP